MGPNIGQCEPTILCFNAEAKSQVALLIPGMPSFFMALITVTQSMMWDFTSSMMHGTLTLGVPSSINKLFSHTNACSADLIFWLCNTNCWQPLEISLCHSFSSDTRCPGVTCFRCWANSGPNLAFKDNIGGSATSNVCNVSLYCTSETPRLGLVLDVVGLGDSNKDPSIVE